MRTKDIDRTKLAPPDATWLDVILYSREQIRKENEAMGEPTADTDAPWGIISVKVCLFVAVPIPSTRLT